MILVRQMLVPVALAALIAAGCTKPPSEKIEAAEKAVKDAQQSGAGTYTAEEYAKLEGTLEALKKEVSEQDGKLALFRDYGKVEQLAATTAAEGARVKGEVDKKKEEAKAGALQAQQVAQEAVAATLKLVAKAPVGKDRAAVEAIKSDADALQAALSQIQTAIDKEDYLAAQTQARAINDKSRAVSDEIQSALAKTGKGKSSPSRKN
ncbi:MAG: hypothetical protein OEW25_06965 [Nitrospira sp.]|nr:hypothetical protein [Nitrospira sp.]MDH5253050.1 hypothetical protein [Nitrospira sp.]